MTSGFSYERVSFVSVLGITRELDPLVTPLNHRKKNKDILKPYVPRGVSERMSLRNM